ncbi:OAS [Mytilus coruscus]|uniref:OAS n=1 Tax=Mytilus coruscus TaxID=42192 RepID=A0A6J8AMV4_MYTCO|nr:OAS [Mytilus coruscus]
MATFIWNEGDLEVFIRDHVQTDDAYRRICKGVIKNISEILKNNIKGKYRPDEILKTGSTAKGTAVKGKSDVDLVFLLSRREYQSVDQLHYDLAKILNYIKMHLSHKHPLVLTLEISPPESALLRRIIPVVDIRSIHAKMRGTSDVIRNLYIPSLTKWQRDFVKKSRTEQLKKLTRFVLEEFICSGIVS